jgi:CBS domain-containing protein
MLQGGYSGLPVVDGKDRLIGILTEGDLLRRAELGTGRWHPRWLNFLLGPARLAREYTDSHAQQVSEVMSTEVIAVDESTPLSEAVGLMEQHHVKRLPVLRQGKVVGMLSRADLLRACLSALEQRGQGLAISDDVIRQCVETDMRAQPWDPHATVQVRVSGGRVQLHGVVTSDALREALRVLAENVPGVTVVDDQLTTIEPMTGAIVHLPEEPAST